MLNRNRVSKNIAIEYKKRMVSLHHLEHIIQIRRSNVEASDPRDHLSSHLERVHSFSVAVKIVHKMHDEIWRFIGKIKC